MGVQIELDFCSFLETAGLKKKDLPAIQLQEMRRSFFAGYGMSLKFLEVMDDCTDSEVIEAIDDIKAELYAFWLKENANHNKN